MKSDSHLPNFITLGQQLYILSNSSDPPLLATTIRNFVTTLENCGLRRARTAAEPLNAITQLPRDHLGRVESHTSSIIKAYAKTVAHMLYEEAGERTLVIVEPTGVIDALLTLPSAVKLSAAQQRLCDEAVACIERGAFRSAIVMGWSLAYDYIRQWVFDHHLSAFNTSLTTDYVRRDGNPVYKAIQAYDDFYSGKPSERTVIDTCESANIIGGRVADSLRHFLRRRNDYAHPTFRSPVREQTNAYVKDLVDLILEAPFQPLPPPSLPGSPVS